MDYDTMNKKDEQPMETAQVPEAPAKKPSKAGAIFKGLLLIAIYVSIMSIPQMFVLTPLVLSAVMKAGGDVASYPVFLVEEMSAHSQEITISSAVGMLLAVAVMVLWYVLRVYRKDIKADTYESVAPKLKNIKSILFIICASLGGFSLAILTNRLALWLMPTIGQAFGQSMDTVMGGVPVLGFLMTVVMAPIGEEVCLRGIFLKRASKSFGLVGCIILSGILFGLYHMNPIQGLYAMPIGAIYGYVGYKYKSVIPCIICHMINNLVAMFSSALGFDTWVVPIVCTVVFAALSVFLATRIDFLKAKTE